SNVAHVTVKAHVLDLDGVGLRKVALVTAGSVMPPNAGYFSLTPVLVAGTKIDGDWQAVFTISSPPAEDFGIRLSAGASGFRVPAMTIVLAPHDPPRSDLVGAARTIPCVSTFAAIDAECGTSGLV